MLCCRWVWIFFWATASLVTTSSPWLKQWISIFYFFMWISSRSDRVFGAWNSFDSAGKLEKREERVQRSEARFYIIIYSTTWLNDHYMQNTMQYHRGDIFRSPCACFSVLMRTLLHCTRSFIRFSKFFRGNFKSSQLGSVWTSYGRVCCCSLRAEIKDEFEKISSKKDKLSHFFFSAVSSEHKVEGSPSYKSRMDNELTTSMRWYERN